MVVGSDDPATNADRALMLCEALAAQLAIGIQNANLRRRQLELAAAVHVETRGESLPVPVPVKAGVYRILHEALSNALKHSMASEVRVMVSVDSDSVRMSVKDNGKGFNPENTEAGFGIGSMRRRSGELSGTFEVSSAEGVGTEVWVMLSYTA